MPHGAEHMSTLKPEQLDALLQCVEKPRARDRDGYPSGL